MRADKVLENLRGRRGIRQVLEAIQYDDPDIYDEIRSTCSQIIEDELRDELTAQKRDERERHGDMMKEIVLRSRESPHCTLAWIIECAARHAPPAEER